MLLRYGGTRVIKRYTYLQKFQKAIQQYVANLKQAYSLRQHSHLILFHKNTSTNEQKNKIFIVCNNKIINIFIPLVIIKSYIFESLKNKGANTYKQGKMKRERRSNKIYSPINDEKKTTHVAGILSRAYQRQLFPTQRTLEIKR